MTTQPLFMMDADVLSGVSELMRAGQRQGAILAVSLVSPIESSTTLIALFDGAPPVQQQATTERSEWMEARETLRHLLHPAGRRARYHNAREVLHKMIAGTKERADQNDDSGTLPTMSHRSAWNLFLSALKAGEDRPRAFGVEKAFFVDGRLVSICDLNGSMNDFYQLPEAPPT